MKNKARILKVLVPALIAAQVLIVLLSWIVAAVMPRVPVRSLLNEGGIHWMFYTLADSVTSPAVVWILLYSMAWGAFRSSGMRHAFRADTFRKRLALRTVIAEIIIGAAILLLFTAAPHAILLSITGCLFTPEFLIGIISVFPLFLMLLFITYGTITHNYPSVTTVLDSLSQGIASTSFVWAPYFLLILLIHSVIYVFF